MKDHRRQRTDVNLMGHRFSHQQKIEDRLGDKIAAHRHECWEVRNPQVAN